MFLSFDALKIAAHKLREIVPETAENSGKKRQERVSALRHFLACAELIHVSKQSSVSLAPDQPGRHDLSDAVGRVVAIDDIGNYTPDFWTTKHAVDFATGSNFITTGVRRSRNGTAELPGRPSPLLLLTDEVASLHPDHKANLEKDYALNEINTALALWLLREHNFPDQLTEAEVVDHVNKTLSARYGNNVASLMSLTIAGYQELLDGIASVQVSAKPDLSQLFILDKNAKRGGDAKLSSKPAREGRNIIFYGAPGTGKSHSVDELAGKINVTRTVFHPDTQNSDFFGCLKPGMRSGKVEYAFSAGPFCKALRAALLDTDHQHFLIIEEINRAPAAAVFGELFQLLDRQDDEGEAGRSSYEVAFPNDESKAWMKADDGPSDEALYLPSNLTLLATMNSADQGVYPLDTAFRRRWEQKYVRLYEGDGPVGNISFIGNSGEEFEVSWGSFVLCLNEFLILKYKVAEDRLLGLWFVKGNELGETIPPKILLYLWDDLLRHENRYLIFSPIISRYGEIDQALEDGTVIFGNDFLLELEKVAQTVHPSPSDEAVIENGQ